MAAAGLAVGMLGAEQAAAQSGSVTAQLVGSWSGPGRIELQDGRAERILCNAYYSGSAGQLSMVIRCKSDTQSIEMRSRLTESGGRLTGRWEERTYNAEGEATGTASGSKLNLTIAGAVSGRMQVEVAKSRHTVSITTTGTALKSVTVTFDRS